MKSEDEKVASLKDCIIGHMKHSTKYMMIAARTQDVEFSRYFKTLADTHDQIAKVALKRMKRWLGTWRPSEEEVL